MIEVKMKQFICETCKLKFYLNSDDVKEDSVFKCPTCGDEVKHIRDFEMKIKKITDVVTTS